MIKANELRIGNWLKGAFSGFFQVDGKFIFDLANERPMHFLDVERTPVIQPIPLTPEIFEAAGYIQRGEDYYQPEEQFECLIKESKGYYWISNNEFIHQPPIQYLHQLQNLYFALEGKELEIKMPVHA